MKPAQQSSTLISLLGAQRVIPIVEIENRRDAPDLAKLLVDEGIPVIEVVLRTEEALAAIEAMAAIGGCCVGAGSTITSDQFASVLDAGAAFVVSPGVNSTIMDFATRSPIPILPGAMTPTEILYLHQFGYDFVKLFPAQSAGGPETIRAIAGPLPGIRFCPTGGVNEQTLLSYLGCRSVICAGGSWLTPRRSITDHDWPGIRERIRTTRSILNQHTPSLA